MDFDINWVIERVRESREGTKEKFPLPDVEHSIDYAITEIGETIDAFLRLGRPGDKRNNEKNIDPRYEFGQVGYMICSAIIQIKNTNILMYDLSGQSDKGHDLYSLLVWIAKVRSSHCGGGKSDDLCGANLKVGIHRWCCACINYGWDPHELIEEVCIDFEKKYG